MNASTDSSLQKTSEAYVKGGYRSIRACAGAFNVAYSSLYHRLSGRRSRSQGRESTQILSQPEEKTLVRWIKHLTNTGFPASPALVREMAVQIRRNRIQLSHTPTVYPRALGKNWLDRFRKRHPGIDGVWTRKITGQRHKAVTRIL